jgi:hypothetical protein
MSDRWHHPPNDGWTPVDHRLLEDPARNARLSAILDEDRHVFRRHADGNWATRHEDRYARLIAAAIGELPFLVARLLGTGDRDDHAPGDRTEPRRGSG